jgi:adenosylhomocysteine nucleosidase
MKAATPMAPMAAAHAHDAAGGASAGHSAGASGGINAENAARASGGLTAIVSPLAAELAGVATLTIGREVLRVRGEGGTWRVTLGSLAGEQVALMATGDGAPAAAAGLAALLAALRPRRLLVVGVAGGLTPGLAAGTLVAARRVLAGDGGEAPRRDPDAAWLARALACGAVAGVAVATGAILGGPGAKQAALLRAMRAMRAPRATPAAAAAAAIHGDVGAVAAAATADLESAAYARVAAAWPLPYLVVRAVLDPLEEELPLDFEACRGASGRVSNARVVLRALARPRRLADLWRLRARMEGAAARLGAFAEDLLGDPGAAVHAGSDEERGEVQPAMAATRRRA